MKTANYSLQKSLNDLEKLEKTKINEETTLSDAKIELKCLENKYRGATQDLSVKKDVLHEVQQKIVANEQLLCNLRNEIHELQVKAEAFENDLEGKEEIISILEEDEKLLSCENFEQTQDVSGKEGRLKYLKE